MCVCERANVCVCVCVCVVRGGGYEQITLHILLPWNVSRGKKSLLNEIPGVVPEHVPGTLGEHGMFPVPCSLFP